EYSGMMKGFINNISDEQKSVWTSKQAYLALGFLLVACASNKIDACPMEGFDKAGYDKILDLSSKGLEASVVAPIGYRSEKDDYQHLKKVRKTKNELFTHI
ncbi:MAG: nitroreductase family protein, partial [Calditrichia bacterium]|nr:nitroreductase family protein [Calditrichia bacterium]